MYNDKPLKKHLLIQTICRVNRNFPDKDFGMVIDYIGIRDNMREAMKVYGGDNGGCFIVPKVFIALEQINAEIPPTIKGTTTATTQAIIFDFNLYHYNKELIATGFGFDFDTIKRIMGN